MMPAYRFSVKVAIEDGAVNSILAVLAMKGGLVE